MDLSQFFFLPFLTTTLLFLAILFVSKRRLCMMVNEVRFVWLIVVFFFMIHLTLRRHGCCYSISATTRHVFKFFERSNSSSRSSIFTGMHRCSQAQQVVLIVTNQKNHAYVLFKKMQMQVVDCTHQYFRCIFVLNDQTHSL